MRITEDEWRSELERAILDAQRRDDGGVTAREISEMTGMGNRAVIKRLRLLGPRVQVCRKSITDLAGRTTSTFAYRLVRGEDVRG